MLLSSASKQLVGTMKINGPLHSAAFSFDGNILFAAGGCPHTHTVTYLSRSPFSPSISLSFAIHPFPSSLSLSNSVNGEVYEWDVGSRKCVGRWYDEGRSGVTSLATSADGHLATGSAGGRLAPLTRALTRKLFHTHNRALPLSLYSLSLSNFSSALRLVVSPRMNIPDIKQNLSWISKYWFCASACFLAFSLFFHS